MHARDFSSFVVISVKQKLPTPLSGSCLPFAQHVLYCYNVKVSGLCAPFAQHVFVFL
jgi:hypothetical protein